MSIIDNNGRHLDESMELPDALEVALGKAPDSELVGDATVDFVGDEREDGAVVTFGDAKEVIVDDGEEFDANLAEGMSEGDLDLIASDLMDMIDADISSMQPWRDRIALALEVMGLTANDDDSIPFEGAASITHPLIAEAVVQFNARAAAELLPPKGPCKALVTGDNTAEIREQASRVENHMNFQMTEEDEGYYDEIDQLLFYLPAAGSAFTKTYFDEELQRTTTRFVKGEEVIVPYVANSFDNAPRFTLRDRPYRSEIKAAQVRGLYRDVELVEPQEDQSGDDMIQSGYDQADGRSAVMDEDDPRHTRYEMYIKYDLKGHEDPDGLLIPYIITLDKDSKKILAIRRNWRESDERKRPRKYVTHYKFLPGMGFYGYGYLHILGGIAQACTGSVRALLDSAAFATLQGGFKSKEARVTSGTITLQPGEWADIDLTAEELSKAFYTPPFKEPSPALFQMLNTLEQNGRRFAGTTEATVGDARNTGPVGTTVALIEQSTKVMSGVHKRLHRAQRREFRIRAEINAEYLPEGEELYYDVSGGRNFITSDDYDNRKVNIIPVSDPNITSATQRIAQGQGMMEMVEKDPSAFRRHRVYSMMIDAMGIQNVDDYLIDPEKKQRFDGIGEGSRLIAGKPIWAYPDQDHEAHMTLHAAQMEMFKTLPDEETARRLIVEMTDHMMKHEAYRVHALMNQASMQMTGQELPRLDVYDDDQDLDIPPEVDAAVTQLGLQLTDILMQEAESRKGPSPEQAKAESIAQEEAKKAQLENDIIMKDAQTAEQRRAGAFMAEEERRQKSWEADEIRKSQEAANKEGGEGATKQKQSATEDGLIQAVTDIQQSQLQMTQVLNKLMEFMMQGAQAQQPQPPMEGVPQDEGNG